MLPTSPPERKERKGTEAFGLSDLLPLPLTSASWPTAFQRARLPLLCVALSGIAELAALTWNRRVTTGTTPAEVFLTVPQGVPIKTGV